MTSAYRGPGESMTWTNGTGSAVSADDVVVVGDGLLAVCNEDIADTASGVVHFVGEYDLPKVSAAVIAQGEWVIWDVSASEFDDNAATPATGDVSSAAWATAAAAASTTTVRVRLTGRPGTVT